MINYSPKRSDEPIWWGLFGAGGVWFAMITPVTVLVMGILLPLHGFGLLDITYDKIHAFVSNPIGGGFTVLSLSLPMWHAMHRVHHGLHDLKIHVGAVGKYACYLAAALLTFVALVLVLQINQIVS